MNVLTYSLLILS